MIATNALNATTLDHANIVSLRTTTTDRRANERLAVNEGPDECPESGGDHRHSSNGTPKKSRRAFLLAAITTLVLGVAVGTYCHFYRSKPPLPFETTDDACIEAHVMPVASEVAGRVLQVFVQDNQPVKKGDLLFQIDPTGCQMKLEEARANLAAGESRVEQANAQLAEDEAKVAQEKAWIMATEAEATRARMDYKRVQSLGSPVVSASQLEQAESQARCAAAAAEMARDKQLAAESQMRLSKANIKTAAAELRRDQTSVRQAELALANTQIRAAEGGYITRRSVEPGAYAQTGQPLLAIVPHERWIVANFKETQLARMHTGQRVEVKVDAYPQMRLKGHVESIQAGTGSRTGLSPTESTAAANYVKVTQRVPVKIALENAVDGQDAIGPGMSVVPEVRVD